MDNYIVNMNTSIKALVNRAYKVSRTNFFLSLFLIKLISRQKKAIKLRNKWEENGIHIPPFMIASITSKCNLRCKGCYAHVHNQNCKQELTISKWEDIFNEVRDLGISFILLAGGEPFIREDLIDTVGKYHEIIFPIFTNGTLINEKVAAKLKYNKNIIPVISIEGKLTQTDERRGDGVFNKVEQTLTILKQQNIFYGLSFTLTNKNFDLITSDEYIASYINKKCKLFFYVEFVPVEAGTQDLVISQKQRELLDGKLTELKNKFKALFIAFPGDEKKFGGCLSSGRGFVHISAEGNLEPCPFAPYSDTNLKDITLKEALKSEFLKQIRTSDEHLSETEHGCALFNKKEWVQSLLNK